MLFIQCSCIWTKLLIHESNPKVTTNNKGKNTITMNCIGSNPERLTIYESFAFDGVDMPTFFTVKKENQMIILKTIQKMSLIRELLVVI